MPSVVMSPSSRLEPVLGVQRLEDQSVTSTESLTLDVQPLSGLHGRVFHPKVVREDESIIVLAPVQQCGNRKEHNSRHYIQKFPHSQSYL